MVPFNGDARTVRRAQLFPSKPRPFYEIFHVPGTEEKKFYFLSPRPELYWIHPVQMGPENRWRTQPCTGEGQDCWLSHAEVGSVIQGWAWVLNFQGGKTGLLTFTYGALEDCPHLLDPAQDLRGMEVFVKRAKDTPRSKMIARIGNAPARKSLMHDTPSLVDQLVRLWGAAPRPVKAKDLPIPLKELRRRYAAERGTA